MKLRWDEEEVAARGGTCCDGSRQPATPYSELQTKDSLTVSSKTTTEEFKGNGFTPEGPAGTEPNIPPVIETETIKKQIIVKKRRSRTTNSIRFNVRSKNSRGTLKK